MCLCVCACACVRACVRACVQSIPSYRTVHQEACGLAVYMKLPSFPPVDLKCLQHPTLLTMRYLLLLNLPGGGAPARRNTYRQTQSQTQTHKHTRTHVNKRFPFTACRLV